MMLLAIPLMVLLQIVGKNAGDNLANVLVFPGVSWLIALAVFLKSEWFQEREHTLCCVCLVVMICAILDTTKAASDVTEKNMWVHFIYSLALTSSTGLRQFEANIISTVAVRE